MRVGKPEPGLALARGTCAECRAVTPKELGSGDAAAPSFHRIQRLTNDRDRPLRCATNVASNQAERQVEPDEMRDVVAYILHPGMAWRALGAMITG